MCVEFKSVLRQVCGIVAINKDNFVEQEKKIKNKKIKWQKYLTVTTDETYYEFKEQRQKVKQLVIEAKDNSWKGFSAKK